MARGQLAVKVGGVRGKAWKHSLTKHDRERGYERFQQPANGTREGVKRIQEKKKFDLLAHHIKVT